MPPRAPRNNRIPSIAPNPEARCRTPYAVPVRLRNGRPGVADGSRPHTGQARKERGTSGRSRGPQSIRARPPPKEKAPARRFSGGTIAAASPSIDACPETVRPMAAGNVLLAKKIRRRPRTAFARSGDGTSLVRARNTAHGARRRLAATGLTSLHPPATPPAQPLRHRPFPAPPESFSRTRAHAVRRRAGRPSAR